MGFTRDDVAVAYEMPSTELLASLEKEEAGAADEMQAYLKRTESLRKLERERTDEYIMTRREFSREKYNEKSAKLIKDIDIKSEDITFQSQYAPMILAEFTKHEVERLSHNDCVETLLLHTEPTEQLCAEIDTIKEHMGVNKVSEKYVLTGEGVKIGLFETGGYPLPSCDELQYDKIHNVGGAWPYDHATNSIRIIVGKQNGFAPDAELYCADVDYADIEALVTAGVSLINVSFGWLFAGNESDSVFSYSAKDRWVDHIVSKHNVTVIASVGNYPNTTYFRVLSPAMGHNVIGVGAFGDGGTVDLEDDILWKDNMYINSNGNEASSGVEKPDVIVTKSILSGGTSSSAPVLTGLVALLIQLKPSISTYPQAIKAIVLASCHRKVLPATNDEVYETMYQGITERQGAGAPDFWTMASIVCNGTYGVGRIKGTNTQTVRRFVMPSYGASNMNVSLTWLREGTFVDKQGNALTDPNHTTSTLQAGTAVNLNLSVFRNGTQVGSSNLEHSSTEMAYFNVNNTNWDYEIKINKATTSYTGTVRYGYAYSLDEMVMEPPTDEGIYYIRNYLTDKYLTHDTATDETTLQYFASTSVGRQPQMWVLKGTQGDYEILPAYGSVGEKLNFGAQVGTNPYYKAVLGTSDLNLSLKSWESDTTLEPDAHIFTSTSGGGNNILSYTSSTGIFIRSTTAPVINTYRMWVLEDINYRRGDTTLDGNITINDATAIQKHLGEFEELNNMQFYLADYNRDGVVNIKDVTAIQNYLGSL